MSLRFLLLIGLCFPPLVASAVPGSGEDCLASAPDSSLQRQLERAEDLIRKGRTEEASALLTELFFHLREVNGLQSPFGLRVRLRRTIAWERGDRYAPATEELLRIAEESKKLRLHGLHARALLQMALIHEEQGHPERTLYYLRQAYRLVDEYDLHAVRATYHLRFASYHRHFGELEEAILHGREGLREATLQDQDHDQATAHMLLGILYRDLQVDTSRLHIDRAIALRRMANSDVESLIAYLYLADLNLRTMDNLGALALSDSALSYAARIGNERTEADAFLPWMYELRGQIYRKLNQPDSALTYLDLSRETTIRRMHEISAVRIANLEARYDSEKKQQLILEQEKELISRQRRERLLNIFVLTVVVALLVLAAYFLRLKSANRQLGEQRDTIREKNQRLNEALQEQQLLRGELHHRIKNNLQVIIGLLDMQSESAAPGEAQQIAGLSDRMHSMAAMHDILYSEGNLARLPVNRYLRKLCEHFIHFSGHEDDCVLELDVPSWALNPDTLIPLGTIVIELMMNSCKYAVRGEGLLHLRISMYRVGPLYTLEYRDNGPGFGAEADSGEGSGLGVRLMRGLARQLSGKLEIRSDDGALVLVHFRAKNDTQDGPGDHERRVNTSYASA